ncbi:MAG: DUF2784 domain-containing protein [Planctomycetes bacterium]|nr:DUF2784 domain-containing protein [Planctomycetota bacterium]
MPAFWADVLGLIHLAYVSFVVVGLLLIFAGIIFRWNWIRNPWFRITHLVMIVVVALEAAVNFQCPLTVWENQLRYQAGQVGRGESFIASLVHDIMYWDDVPFDHWAFQASYYGFAALVILTFVVAPPKKPGFISRVSSSTSSSREC